MNIYEENDKKENFDILIKADKKKLRLIMNLYQAVY